MTLLILFAGATTAQPPVTTVVRDVTLHPRSRELTLTTRTADVTLHPRSRDLTLEDIDVETT